MIPLKRSQCPAISIARPLEGEEDLRVGEMLIVEDGVIVASRVYHS